MKEHHRTDRLTLITIIFVIVIGVILITYRAPRLGFEISPDEMLSLMDNKEYVLPVDQAQQLLEDPNVQFIDIRSKGEYVVSQVKGAINIPLAKILDEESIELFEEEGKEFVLYGVSHREANATWMLLRQLGMENIKVLLGGFENYTTDSLSFPHFYSNLTELEQAEYDLNTEMANRSRQIQELDAEKVEASKTTTSDKPRASVKKSTPAPLLPPPPVEEEEEEEGC